MESKILESKDDEIKVIPMKTLYYSLKKLKRNRLYIDLFFYIIF